LTADTHSKYDKLEPTKTVMPIKARKHESLFDTYTFIKLKTKQNKTILQVAYHLLK